MRQLIYGLSLHRLSTVCCKLVELLLSLRTVGCCCALSYIPNKNRLWVATWRTTGKSGYLGREILVAWRAQAW
jgi:hypothetical protein